MKDQQAKMLKFIHEYHVEKGWSPSLREIQSALYFGSTNSVWYWLDYLEKDGYITRAHGIPRAMSITKLGQKELLRRKLKDGKSK